MFIETKKILISSFLALVLFTFIPVFNVSAAGLTVCGTTDPAKIKAYQDWLINNPKPAESNQAALQQYYRDLSNIEKQLDICQTKDVFDGIARLVNVLIGYIGVIVIGRIVISGFMMVASTGNPEAISTQKKNITNAFIGLVIVMGTYLILNVFYSVFDVPSAFHFTFNPFK